MCYIRIMGCNRLLLVCKCRSVRSQIHCIHLQTSQDPFGEIDYTLEGIVCRARYNQSNLPTATFAQAMPKRSREDSPSSSTASSLSPTPDPPSPALIDAPIHRSKYIQTSDKPSPRAVMKCSLPPHHDTISFSTFDEFEIHYAKEHAHRCSECRKNFPTEHFLGLHISENHDPLTEARIAKGEKTVSLSTSIICGIRSAVLIAGNSIDASLKTATKSARTPRNDECMYVLSVVLFHTSVEPCCKTHFKSSLILCRFGDGMPAKLGDSV